MNSRGQLCDFCRALCEFAVGLVGGLAKECGQLVGAEPHDGLFGMEAQDALSDGFGRIGAVGKGLAEGLGCSLLAGFEIVALQMYMVDVPVGEVEVYLDGSAACDVGFAHDAAAIVAASPQVGLVVVGLLDLLDGCHVGVAEGEGAVGQLADEVGTQFVEADGEVVFEQSDSATHALDAASGEFLGRGGECAEHERQVGVVEHGAVDDVPAGHAIEGVAAYLAVVEGLDVVPAADLHGCAEAAERLGYGLSIFGIEFLHGKALGDEAEHEVALLGKDRAASALAPAQLDVVGAAEVEVEFGPGVLVDAEDAGGRHSPGEEIAVLGEFFRHVLLGGQEEGYVSSFDGRGKQYVAGREVGHGVGAMGG